MRGRGKGTERRGGLKETPAIVPRHFALSCSLNVNKVILCSMNLLGVLLFTPEENTVILALVPITCPLQHEETKSIVIVTP